MNELNPFAWHGAPYLVFYTIACLVSIGIASLLKMQILGKLRPDLMTTSNEGEAIASKLNAYEAAAIQGGNERVLASALATLSSHDMISLDATSGSIFSTGSGRFGSDLHPVERAILQRAKNKGVTIDTLKNTIIPEMNSINGRLQELGLIPPAHEIAMSRFFPMLVIAVSACTLAMPKIIIGNTMHKPVILLFAEMVLFCLISLLFLREQSETTGKGDVVLGAMRRSGSALRLTSTSNPGSLSLADTAFAYALFGGMALATDPFAQAMRLIRPQTSSGSSGGCGGSGCGSSSSCGSSCGGGCGGCGGCGG